MTDTTHDDLVKRLRYGCNLQQRDGEHAADRIEELEAKLAQQDDLVQAANRLAEYLNGDHIYMERVHHLAAAIREGGE